MPISPYCMRGSGSVGVRSFLSMELFIGFITTDLHFSCSSGPEAFFGLSGRLKGSTGRSRFMNKVLMILILLIMGGLGIAVVKRAAFSSEKQVPMNYLSEDLKDLQGEWYAATTNGDRSFSAEFQGRSFRLVSGTQWRKTHTVSGLDKSKGKSLIVIDDGADALVYRFESEDVLWLEFHPDTRMPQKAIRFRRVLPLD